jgi:hypothetical protein
MSPWRIYTNELIALDISSIVNKDELDTVHTQSPLNTYKSARSK